MKTECRGRESEGEKSCRPAPVTVSCMFDLMFFEKRVQGTSQWPCPVPIRREAGALES